MPSPPSLDDLAALDPARRRELAAALRGVAETLAEVRDAKTASHVVGVLAQLLDPPEAYYIRLFRNGSLSRRRSEILSTAKLGTLLCRASPVFAGEPRSGRLA